MNKVKVLDCTLRDGGYYNNWDFSETLLQDYLQAVCAARIEMVELGLRAFGSTNFKGAHAFTTETFLSGIKLPEGPEYGVMVDAKTIIKSQHGVDRATRVLFTEKSESQLSFVRVAAHYKELHSAIEICQTLKNLGYFVGLNLMQSVGKSDEQISDAARSARLSNCIDVLYFADSLGNMESPELERIIKCIKNNWDGEIGLHAHDNTSKALAHTLAAYSLGVNYLDSTITGMGRGAGNTKTEILLFELSQRKIGNFDYTALYELVLKYFEPLQREYGWGSNLLYHIGAIHNVHPTYIQQLYSDKRFGPVEQASAINYLGSISATNYDENNLEEALNLKKNHTSENHIGNDISGLFKNREILLLGAGESIHTYKKAISQYIKKQSPIVISININETIEDSLIDFYVISHNTKYLSDKDKYKELEEKIIAPSSLFPNDNLFFKYSYELQTGKPWRMSSNSCDIPFDNTSAYAFSICLSANARAVSIIGFDGYPNFDNRNKEVQEVLDYFKSRIEVKCLSPTNYNVAIGSIYAI